MPSAFAPSIGALDTCAAEFPSATAYLYLHLRDGL